MEQFRSSIAGVMNQEFNKTLDAKPAEEKCIETPEVIEELYFLAKKFFIMRNHPNKIAPKPILSIIFLLQPKHRCMLHRNLCQ